MKDRGDALSVRAHAKLRDSGAGIAEFLPSYNR
jgi:hypothetical protein